MIALQARYDNADGALSAYLPSIFRSASLVLLPARSGCLKVIKNVPVNSQRDKLLGIRNTPTLRREFRGFVVAVLNAASAASRELVVLRVLSAGILFRILQEMEGHRFSKSMRQLCFSSGGGLVSSGGGSDSARSALRSVAFSSFFRCFSSLLARAARARSARSLP